MLEQRRDTFIAGMGQDVLRIIDPKTDKTVAYFGKIDGKSVIQIPSPITHAVLREVLEVWREY